MFSFQYNAFLMHKVVWNNVCYIKIHCLYNNTYDIFLIHHHSQLHFFVLAKFVYIHLD